VADIDWSEPEEYIGDNVAGKAKEEPGLYWLSREVWGQGQKVFYIGASDNIRRDLLRHLRPDEENGVIREKLRYGPKYRVSYSNAPAAELEAALAGLVGRHRPPGNTAEQVA
jgi:hypothetical protein